MNAVDKKYDVILVDAYQDITIPFQMSSVEFFTLVSGHLNPGGVMAVNMNMRREDEGNINQYLSDTISTVFKNVYTIDVSGSTNRMLFAFDSERAMDVFESNTRMEPHEDLSVLMQKIMREMSRYEPGEYVMTDSKAPVELLGMRVIDALIRDEVRYYKDIYEREGIQGILENF